MSDSDAKRREEREREKKEEKAKKKAKSKEHRNELYVQRLMNWKDTSLTLPIRTLSLSTSDIESESDETVVQPSDSKNSKGKEPEVRTSESKQDDLYDQRVKAWKDALSTLPVTPVSKESNGKEPEKSAPKREVSTPKQDKSTPKEKHGTLLDLMLNEWKEISSSEASRSTPGTTGESERDLSAQFKILEELLERKPAKQREKKKDDGQRKKRKEPEKIPGEKERDEVQTERLKEWTEKPFPVELRPGAKTPFLHQFSQHQLKEGLIHVLKLRWTLGNELDQVLDIYTEQYKDNEQLRDIFQALLDEIDETVARAEYDQALVMDEAEDDEFELAIRGYEDPSQGKFLRYNICIYSRQCYHVKGHIDKFRRAIGVAQGDIER